MALWVAHIRVRLLVDEIIDKVGTDLSATQRPESWFVWANPEASSPAVIPGLHSIRQSQQI